MRSPADLPTAPRREVGRFGFAARLVLTLVLTIAVVGGVQYLLAARQLEKRVTQQSVSALQTDGRVLIGLHENARGDRLAPVKELLGHIASRPGFSAVALVGPDGDVVAAGRSHGAMAAGGAMAHGAAAKPAAHGAAAKPPAHGAAAKPAAHGAAAKGKPKAAGHEAATPMGGQEAAMPMGSGAPGGIREGARLPAGLNSVVEGVLVDGTPYGGDDPRSGDEDVFAAPVELSGRRHVLVALKEEGLAAAQMADLRWVLLLTLGLGLPLALPIFYLAGGRSLTARHTLAVHRSVRDPLTGLGNHRSFHEEVRRLASLAARRDRPFSVALVDVDRFKLVNDTHGHRRGDEVLAHVASVLASGRAEDRPFRVGGDEFAVLLPDTTADEAVQAMDRVRARVVEDLGVVSTSIGVAQFQAPAADVDTLLASADLALYQAKDRGRDKVVSFADLGRDVAAA